ncbi:MAG: choice-of-anchor G family protein, partial [Corynebacterium casei]|uniref:choice-of-anchor G family protein n=1 Tax=Corynebacterium casei TaxID=160386 RepID=UPI003F8D9B92
MHSHSPSVSARLIQKRKWLRLGIATLTSTALVGGTLVPVPTNSFFQHSLVAEAAAQEAVLSHAEGQVIDLSLLRDFVHPEDMGIFDGLVEAIQAQQSFTGNENNSPETSQLDVEALQAIRLNLGGITLPLVDDGSGNGLLQLGTDGIGVLSAYASAPDATSAHAAAGVVDEDGAINLDPTQGAGNVETNLQLTAVLNQLGLGPVTDTIADDLALRLGAVSSMAQAEGGEVTSEYAVANAELYLHSPLVEEVGGLVKPGGLGEDLDNVVNGLLGEDGLVGGQIVGLVSGLLSTLRLGNIELNATTNLEATLDELLGQPLTSEDELVTIDLQSGEVKVNLEKLHGDNLSNLEPNTPLVNAEQLTRITSTVDGLLDSLSQRITDTLNNGVLDTRLVIEISLLGGLVGKTRIDGTLSQILAGTAPVTGGGLLGVLLNPLVNGLVNGLGPILGNVDEDGNLQVTILNDIIGNLLTPVNALLGDGSVLGLSGLIDEVLGEVAQVTINSQPNELIAAQGSVDGRPNARRGTLTDPSEDFSVVPVRAQVLRLGTDGGVVDLPLARSTVKATDIDDPILNAPELLDIDPNQGPRSGGNEVTLTGTNLADIDTIYVNETAITVFELDAEAGTVTFVAPAWADLDTTEDEVEVSVATNGVRSKSLGYTYVDDVPGAADHNPGYEWVNIKAGETLVIDQTKDTGLPDGMNFEINPEFDGPSGWDFTITDPATGALEITAPDDAAPGMVFRVPVIATYPDGTTDDLSARVNVVMTPFEIVETIPGDTSITIRFSDGTVIEVPYGEAGQDGQDGQDGLTPQVGENGNWWIGEIDTGVPATGADGEDGADGESVEIVSKTVDPETRTITIAFSDGNTIVIRAGQDGADGEDGESLTVVDYYLNVDGDLVIEFSDESTVIVPKGADGADGSDGESVTITDRSVDADGNIVIEFSDGTIVTIPKGEKGDQGVPGQDGKSAYELWLEAGNVGDINDFLESLKGADGQDGNDGAEGQPGVDGKSAYELWLEAGNEGDVDDFLESLIGQPGADGKSAYDLWIEDGNSGSKQDFLDSLKGDQGVPGQDGKSAYELW